MRKRCLSIISILVFSVCTVRAAEPVGVPSRTFDIDYVVNEDAQPLTAVQLWYTLNGGEKWHLFGEDEDRQPPVRFDASTEGLHGFYFVLRNDRGTSNGAPVPGTEPQAQASIDYTPLVVQLHDARESQHLGQRTVQIRWTAVDDHFGPRPIEVEYRRFEHENWQSIGGGAITNTGRLDWRVPDELEGRVELRVSARDRGGHRSLSEPIAIELADEETVTAVPEEAPEDGEKPVQRVASIVNEAEARANRLFLEAIALRDQHEYRAGINRLREAVRLNPDMTDAFAEMAGMLYRLGDVKQAGSAYEIALSQNPEHRDALRGVAMVATRQKKHQRAAGFLRKILESNPRDAQVWLDLGDVAIFSGDELLARECYQRAVEVGEETPAVVEEARKRLALMASTGRNR